jgi:hypothetical protein
LRFGDTPWRDPFAAHVVDVDGGFFQDGNRDPLARECDRNRASTDSAANDNYLGCFQMLTPSRETVGFFRTSHLFLFSVLTPSPNIAAAPSSRNK